MGYGDEQFDYVSRNLVGLKGNKTGVMAAKNISVFIVQAICDRLRMVVAYYFVKNLKQAELGVS